MLDSENVSVYIKSLNHRKIKIGSEKYKGTELVGQFEMSAKLASELGVKERLYRRGDGDADPDVEGFEFTMKLKAQRIELRVDPSLTPSLVLPDCRIKKTLKVRRPSDGSNLVATFRAEFAEVSGDDLLYLKEALWESRFLTFTNAKAGLFDEADREERKNDPASKPVKASKRRTSDEVADGAGLPH